MACGAHGRGNRAGGEAFLGSGGKPEASILASFGQRAFRYANQRAKGGINGLRVWKILTDIGRKKDNIRACIVAREIFSADAPSQLGKVVLPAQSIICFPLLSFPLHSVFAHAGWFYVR